jgi:hypothetical protein
MVDLKKMLLELCKSCIRVALCRTHKDSHIGSTDSIINLEKKNTIYIYKTCLDHFKLHDIVELSEFDTQGNAN